MAALHAAQEEHQRFLRRVIDTNPHFVFVKDWDGRYVLVNEATAQFYGTTVEQLLGKRDMDFNRNPDEVESFLRVGAGGWRLRSNHQRRCVPGAGPPRVTPEVRARVFDLFFTTKEIGKGTGLGMAVIYGLVKQHEGYVDLESEPGRGTTVRLFFPAVHSSQRASPNGSDTGSALRGSERILIVDDEEGIRRSAFRVLGRHGYAVEGAPDGEAALARISNGGPPIDLVLTDVVMQRKGGVALLASKFCISPGA